VTDLHQGFVWGTNTLQTVRDERLINRFDYDGDYGTVLNRFLMQAALDIPLTVYGTGGQTRAFIHISDTARCIDIAIKNPPKTGDKVEIFNQIAETLRVRDLANLISDKTGCGIRNLENPRKEDAENELDVIYFIISCLLILMLIYWEKGVQQEILQSWPEPNNLRGWVAG
jgi:UDP-sulfoquinovose synthase